MRLPILISVPHAGLEIPLEVARRCRLGLQEIADDGDGGAREVYAVQDHVECFVTTEVARAVVDLNRAEDDRRRDGVVKTHTCWNVPVYRRPLPGSVVETLLGRYHRPYHRRLSELAASGQVRFGLDCHTMAASGPPVGPDPGAERPPICISNGEGSTCPDAWVEGLADCMARIFKHEVRINSPFKGGFIVRSHACEMPWIQVEMSRAPFLDLREKRLRFVAALAEFCAWLEGRARNVPAEDTVVQKPRLSGGAVPAGKSSSGTREVDVNASCVRCEVKP